MCSAQRLPGGHLHPLFIFGTPWKILKAQIETQNVNIGHSLCEQSLTYLLCHIRDIGAEQNSTMQAVL